MTLNEFIENLKGLNDGENFSDELLESLYNAIKNDPLECADIDVEDMPYEDRVGSLHNASNSNTSNYTMRPLGCNPFLQLPDPHLAKEYKFGWLLRKCCTETDGKKAAFLKRSWKMFYASLRDMVLYLHKDEKGFKANTFDNISNAIRIHHAYASVASDYKKKQFVFRLKTADWAEYLFQTSNTSELNEWVNLINLVAAMFSSPPLASAVGSAKTFQRPLLPVSVTRYTLQEQFDYHKKHVKQIQYDLNKVESTKDDKSFEKDKYNYYVFEVSWVCSKRKIKKNCERGPKVHIFLEIFGK
jgi:PH/SEC7 domain-containing protein